MVEGQVVPRDPVDPVDLEQELPHVARRPVVDAEGLVDAGPSSSTCPESVLVLREAVERVAHRPSVALREGAYEWPTAPLLRRVVEASGLPLPAGADDHARCPLRHPAVHVVLNFSASSWATSRSEVSRGRSLLIATALRSASKLKDVEANP